MALDGVPFRHAGHFITRRTENARFLSAVKWPGIGGGYRVDTAWISCEYRGTDARVMGTLIGGTCVPARVSRGSGGSEGSRLIHSGRAHRLDELRPDSVLCGQDAPNRRPH